MSGRNATATEYAIKLYRLGRGKTPKYEIAAKAKIAPSTLYRALKRLRLK